MFLQSNLITQADFTGSDGHWVVGGYVALVA